MENIRNIELELLDLGDQLYDAEIAYGEAKANLIPFAAIEKIKLAYLESKVIDVSSEDARKRHAKLTKEWSNFVNQISDLKVIETRAISLRDGLKAKFESKRSSFSLRKSELTMLGSEFDKSKARG